MSVSAFVSAAEPPVHPQTDGRKKWHEQIESVSAFVWAAAAPVHILAEG